MNAGWLLRLPDGKDPSEEPYHILSDNRTDLPHPNGMRYDAILSMPHHLTRGCQVVSLEGSCVVVDLSARLS